MYKLFVFILVWITNAAFGQIVHNQNHISELDHLYEKYKEKDSVRVHTSFGDVTGSVKVFKKLDEKPSKIEIAGYSDNKSAVLDFLTLVINLKMKKGYMSKEIDDKLKDKSLSQTIAQINPPFSLTFFKADMYFKIQLEYGQKWDNTSDKFAFVIDTEIYRYKLITGLSSGHGEKVKDDFEF